MHLPSSFLNHAAARRIAASTALLFALAAATTAGAVELGPDGEPIQADSAEGANRYLGNVYKDEASGIRFAPPAGSVTITRSGGNDLVSYINKEKQSGGAIVAIVLKNNTSVEDYMRTSAGEMSKKIRAVQVLESRALKFGGRSAGKLVTTMESEVEGPPPRAGAKPSKQLLAIFRQQLIVQVLPNQFIALEYFTPLKDKAEAAATFDAMVGSFEIFDKELVAKRRVLAIEEGKKWLAQRSADELKSKRIAEPQLFRIKVGGKDTGYIRFDELETRRAESLGLMIGVSSRNWLADGRAVLGQNLAYWAYSRDEKGNPRPSFFEWENGSKTFFGKNIFWVQEAGTVNEEGGSPIDEATRKELQKEREDLLRRKVLSPAQMPPPITQSVKQTHLIVTFMGDKSQDYYDTNKGINVIIPDFRPAVLPKILEYSWPRVIDLSKKSEMTFAVFNSNSRKMTLRTLSVAGPERVRINGKPVDTIKCTDEMDTMGTTLWVDNTGRILRMLTSDQSLMEPTNPGSMQELWGNKLHLFDQK